MAYNKDNATTFNQLIQQGLSVEQAAQLAGVSDAASSYGYGTNSNAGAVIPGAGGIIDIAGLTQVLYTQPGVALNSQSPLQTTSALFADPRIIVGAPPPPTIVADPINANTSGIPIPNDEGIAAEGIRTNPETGETYYTTVTDQQRVASEQAATIDANTSGIPIPNDEGIAAEGIRTNPETGETYYTDPPATDPTTTDAPADVVQSDAETARLARLELDATPNETSAEFNRLQEKNVQAVVGTQLAQRQAVLDAQRKMVNNGDWRVRLSLAQGAQYLYNASSPGILAPLAKTGGVIFPYMPKIDMAYKANYTPYDLTHSNYRGYFYQNSSVDSVNLTATFTAQDTTEADYLLAVIHFFRSVTKMFYGQDAQRGAPPPLVYLTGLGIYQFSAHPCAVTTFTYNLPNDVDYIRAGSTNINGTNLLTRRTRQDLPTNPVTGAVKRLENLFSSQGINKGAISSPSAPPTLGKNSPTYVPTKIDLSIGLIPMQTRAQVSQVFSLKSFANGDLIKGGFW
jgi:hypothetical protein